MTILVEKLNREAGAAAARGGHVRIVQLELGADQIVDEIELGAVQEAERDRIDDHPRAVPLDQEIVGGALRHQVEAVLETGAAAALDAHAQQRKRRLALEDLGDAVRGAVAYGDGSLAHRGCSQSLTER